MKKIPDRSKLACAAVFFPVLLCVFLLFGAVPLLWLSLLIAFLPFTGRKYSFYVGLAMFLVDYDQMSVFASTYMMLMGKIFSGYLALLDAINRSGIGVMQMVEYYLLGTVVAFLYPFFIVLVGFIAACFPGMLAAWWLRRKVIKRIGKSALNMR